MKPLFLALVLVCLPALGLAQGSSPMDQKPPPPAASVLKLYLGVNGIWFDGPDGPPADLELGAGARASLSPHISLVGSGWYGASQSYFRGSIGARLTVTDVTNPDFSIGVGAQYQASTKPEIRPQEWCPDVSVGWRPWPKDFSPLTLVAQGAYGMESNRAYLLAGARYALPLY